MKETNKARSAFEDYYNMGPGRSIRKLIRFYNEPATKNPPTKHFSTLAQWSKHHGWQQRVQQRDLEISEAALDAMKEVATRTGYAIFQKRIHDLGKLAERMFDLLKAGALQPKVIREYRGLLADIAAEMGEREKKHTIHVEDWRSEVVQLLLDGKITQEDIINDLGNDLATELFIAAGISISEAREVAAEGQKE